MEQPFTHSGTRAREDWRAQVLAAAKQVDNPFDAYAARPFALPEGRTIRPQDLKGAKAALYVISRIAGEGKNRRLEPGDYYLSDAERADLQTLDESGLPVVLLLNAGGPVELTGLLDGIQHLDAILQLSQLGQQGGQAVADVLLGRAVPEGKLTATWARRYDDIPCARAFGSLNGDVSQDTYRDGVYVGYRYFDSFGVRPLFAFGFGLSYTTFALRAAGLDVQPGHLAAQVEVANTGARFAGREVAQVYLSAPQGELPRERRRLADFAKTRRLAPGETQTLTLEIPQKQLAAFHPEQNAWVVDAGLYGVWVGNSSDALRLSLIMTDSPAGLRLRQCYQADRATGEVYGDGVLGSLENGFLEAPPRHESADTYYQFCTAFPVGTALAQSWDPDLLAQVGRAVSREMDEFHVDLWLAPGMNIQRNPLCGRNFEYYSEDPLLTGTLAAAITAGVQESERHGVTLKHFACNNQEDNRMAVDARVSERALREIYLRGFEIAVKAAAPAAVMSAYNCINGVHAANSRDLCTVVLRQEWGFAGLVISDWNTTVPQDGSTPWRCA
ncbi:glycoside hydrolase family 3 protein [Allofournierella massiliensis]|uniref:beta-glucosidase n=1 Tax=Allofournierella massiliensis TaxID=1650663 RepID=UPI0024B244C0|nr:glycoside hydrolase family 3 N-terminal domain-containing protein [Fournierella massiliensis]